MPSSFLQYIICKPTILKHSRAQLFNTYLNAHFFVHFASLYKAISFLVDSVYATKTVSVLLVDVAVYE